LWSYVIYTVIESGYALWISGTFGASLSHQCPQSSIKRQKLPVFTYEKV
jgi:hypothetical protein